MVKVAKLLKVGGGDGDIAPLADDPDFQELTAELARIEQRRAQTEARRKAALARKSGRSSSAGLLDKARLLLDGGRVTGADPDAELAACDVETEALRAAEIEVRERLDEVVGRLSFEACQSVRDRHNAALRAAFEAMEGLWNAATEINRIKAEIAAAGLRPRSDVLPAPLPSAAFMLGDPQAFGTQAGDFRRWLEAEGI